jgi:hypothetical protein
MGLVVAITFGNALSESLFCGECIEREDTALDAGELGSLLDTSRVKGMRG